MYSSQKKKKNYLVDVSFIPIGHKYLGVLWSSSKVLAPKILDSNPALTF